MKTSHIVYLVIGIILILGIIYYFYNKSQTDKITSNSNTTNQTSITYPSGVPSSASVNTPPITGRIRPN